jgi:putative intracellular protease/amidase
MKRRTCLLFVFDGYSDWEPALAIAGLQQFTDVEVKTFSIDGQAVTSMGNIKVSPDMSLQQARSRDASMLILPGGNSWDEGANTEILPLLKAYNEKKLPIAAICGATSFLAQHSFLDERPHTSNHLEFYLKKKVKEYKGDEFYRKEPCVVDDNLITANGTATVPFAEAIFTKLGVAETEELTFWFQFFTHPEIVLQ